jgi:hypothetical protein
MLIMKKRGELTSKTVFVAILGAVVILLLFMTLRGFGELKEQESSIEITNLKQSLITKIRQQSVRPEGSVINYTVAVPSEVDKICFFDTNIGFDRLRDSEIIALFEQDVNNNLFIVAGESYYRFGIDELKLDAANNPLCIRIIDNKISLQLITNRGEVEIKANQEDSDVKCVSVYENGAPDGKIDVVFIGYGFDDVEEYNKQVNRYVNNILLEFAPFNEYRDRFNFYRIDDADLDCEIGSFIQCEQYDIKRAASDCPNDFIFVLVDRSAFSDFVKPVRSSAIGNIAKINTADKPFVLVHEFGHSFADLADEYVDENYYSDSNFRADDYINCDASPCNTWTGTSGASCYEGCSLRKYFRPTKDSIMRSLASPDFGPVNSEAIKRRMENYQ